MWAQRTSRDFNCSRQRLMESTALDEIEPTQARELLLPLTYMSASAFPADVLRDGRILFEAGFPLGEGSTPELFLVYADGSGVESFRCDHAVLRRAVGWNATGIRRRGVYARHIAGAVYFAAGA